MKMKPTPTKRLQVFTSPTALACKTPDVKEQAAMPLNDAYTALIQRVHNSNDYSVLRLDASATKMGRANSTFWADVKKGTVTPPIPLGEKSVGWLLTELDAILAARTLASRANMALDIKLFVSLLAAPRLAYKECTVTVDGIVNV
jgi:predicted DNA-binding transcriptional regulator AlpA